MNNLKNTYIALLRGINVGGKNSIKMVDLKLCFETMGFTEVSTYIQSGNVLFTSTNHDQEFLTETIESTLSKTFNYKARVVTVSYKQLKETVEQAPHGFGREATTYRYDVIFLKPPLTASEAMERITVKEGVDQVYAGQSVLYFSRLIEKATQSRISRIISLPIYQNMTIRNWNTTTKLLALMK
ncbi:MAG: hypothetical protein RI947_790 [Candidatus Parcubacteria bacterium]|jgi:uncharacterized protein (DUF1697 family)